MLARRILTEIPQNACQGELALQFEDEIASVRLLRHVSLNSARRERTKDHVQMVE